MVWLHFQQRPFKCPNFNGLRFDSFDALNQHLIIDDNEGFCGLQLNRTYFAYDQILDGSFRIVTVEEEYVLDNENYDDLSNASKEQFNQRTAQNFALPNSWV
ncbi:hypothetical protein GLOIN_2v1480509 [Rhizophagus clarus]|uniref:C2H2-type domain-containing protein n=1 Tax=Rhizophagus clarus TaxID=94130 RepID=A0A8H3QU98_9GLOM|nr:hypothetical protein GLOIN_2v1480509 [Rhizophagus clarus]